MASCRLNTSCNRVTVEAGCTVEQLEAFLIQHDRTLSNMGDIRAQTIAGALATCTHGSGGTLMTDAVTSCTLMDDNGSVHMKTRGSVDFNLVFAQGAGMVVLEVEMKIQPIFYL